MLVITPDGTLLTLYDESLDLAALGALSIRRASYVEPTATGSWLVDLTPVGGPVLGPYPRRSAALEAERVWFTPERLAAVGSVSPSVPTPGGSPP